MAATNGGAVDHLAANSEGIRQEMGIFWGKRFSKIRIILVLS